MILTIKLDHPSLSSIGFYVLRSKQGTFFPKSVISIFLNFGFCQTGRRQVKPKTSDLIFKSGFFVARESTF